MQKWPRKAHKPQRRNFLGIDGKFIYPEDISKKKGSGETELNAK
jgi:hypothetical protein